MMQVKDMSLSKQVHETLKQHGRFELNFFKYRYTACTCTGGSSAAATQEHGMAFPCMLHKDSGPRKTCS